MSTSKSDLLRIIRRYCLNCAGGQAKEVRLCRSEDCPLWLFRMGKDPYKTPKQLSAAQRENLAKGRMIANAHRTEKPLDISNEN